MPITIRDENGANQEIELDEKIYRAAAESSLSVSAYLDRRFPTNTEQYGTVLQQAMVQTGFYMQNNPACGITKSKIGELLDGSAERRAGVVVRDGGTPTSRIIFPAVILSLIENALKTDYASDVALFNQTIGLDEAINGPRWEQPIVDFSIPSAARTAPIGQLAEPKTMMTLTVSDVTRSIPTFSLGMVVSDEAKRAATIDIVALSLARQAEVEKGNRIYSYLSSMVSGDADLGMSALSSVKASSYDSDLTVDGTLSHKAWIKWLRANRLKATIDWIFCDINSYLSIINRTGRPVGNTTTGSSVNDKELLSVITDPQNTGLPSPKVFIVDNGAIAANTIVGIDSRYAIRRITNTQASYTASEQLIMRRGEALRFDFGEVCHRLFDDAWSVLSLVA